MAFRRPLLISAVCATALLTGTSTAFAAAPTAHAPSHEGGAAHGNQGSGPGKDSLRDLGARVGLRVGTAVNTDLLGEDGAYTDVVNREFSTVTPENVMKWQLVEPTRGTYDWSGADELVASAKANKQLVRGHTLVWHSQLPDWLQSTITSTKDASGNQVDVSSIPKAELQALLKKHVQDEVSHFRGDIWQWDVVNEAFNEDGSPRHSIWYDAFDGTDYIAQAFRWAHEADPKAELFYNDYNIEFTGPKSNAAYDLIKDLKAQGVPIDGVGFQTHLATQYGFPDLQANLERFAALDLDVAETEVDIRSYVVRGADGTYTSTPTDALNGTQPSTAAQAKQEQYWSDSLAACLAVKRCISYTVWGVNDGSSWIPGVFPGEGAALLFDDSFQPKPQYSVVQAELAAAKGTAPHRGGRGAGRG